MIEEKYPKMKYMVLNTLLFFCFFALFDNLSTKMRINVFASETKINFKNETKLFNRYFNFNLKQVVPKEKYYYLVIKTTGCSGCATQSLDKIKNLKFVDNFSLILSGELEIDSNLINSNIKNVIYDENEDFFKFNISPLNNCLIQVENQAVTNIIKFGKVIETQKLKHVVKN